MPTTDLEFVEMSVDEPPVPIVDLPGITTPAAPPPPPTPTATPLVRDPRVAVATSARRKTDPEAVLGVWPEDAPRRREMPVWLGPVIAIAAIAALAAFIL
ncbi:MAG: hypothetical protein KC635_17260 [Myxococcales bacterium]|nr:hypothetical protein [Myxococcales bacterium]MCB9732694.1 hypothetical protein [Deltaproteobacteria bacterium]